MSEDDRKTILIVEDDHNDAERLQDVLQTTFRLLLVNEFDPYKVRDLLAQADIAMVDLYEDTSQHPKGLEIIKHIAGADRKIPIIVMTSPGRVELATLAKAIEDGTAQDFLWKHGPAQATPAEINLKVRGAITRAQNTADAASNTARSLRLMLGIIIVTTLGALISRTLGSENVGKGLQFASVLIAAVGSIGIKRLL